MSQTELRIIGAAFGGRRVSAVDISVNGEETRIPASIIQSLPEDHVWVFWEAYYTPGNRGSLTIQSRATSVEGYVQPEFDDEYLDGSDSGSAFD